MASNTHTTLMPRVVNQTAVTRTTVLAAALREVEEDDINIIKAASLARHLDSVEHGLSLLALNDADLGAAGWTRADLRVAVDAKKPEKEAGYWLKMTQRRAELRWRDGAGEKPSNNLTIIIPQPEQRTQKQRDDAPVIDVNPTGEP